MKTEAMCISPTNLQADSVKDISDEWRKLIVMYQDKLTEYVLNRLKPKCKHWDVEVVYDCGDALRRVRTTRGPTTSPAACRSDFSRDGKTLMWTVTWTFAACGDHTPDQLLANSIIENIVHELAHVYCATLQIALRRNLKKALPSIKGVDFIDSHDKKWAVRYAELLRERFRLLVERNNSVQ